MKKLFLAFVKKALCNCGINPQLRAKSYTVEFRIKLGMTMVSLLISGIVFATGPTYNVTTNKVVHYTDAGFVGIGTDDPNAKLDIVGISGASHRFYENGSSERGKFAMARKQILLDSYVHSTRTFTVSSGESTSTVGVGETMVAYEGYDEDWYQGLVVESKTATTITMTAASIAAAGITGDGFDYAPGLSFLFGDVIDNSHAEGYQTIAEGVNSHVEGVGSHAEGYASHAEGGITYASYDYAHAEGYSSHAEGGSSHAEGGDTYAEGSYSHAGGYSTHAASLASRAIGRYNIGIATESNSATNWYNLDSVFEIGIGTGVGSEANAMTVLKNGNVGIGTATPASLLDINGDIHLSDMTEPGTTTNKLYAVGGILKWNGTTVATGILSSNSMTDADGDTLVQVEESADEDIIRFDTAGTQQMILDANGDLGVNVADPTAKLHVSGAVKFDDTSSTDAIQIGSGKIYWDTANSELVIEVN